MVKFEFINTPVGKAGQDVSPSLASTDCESPFQFDSPLSFQCSDLYRGVLPNQFCMQCKDQNATVLLKTLAYVSIQHS
jgi:hypothetical protein